MKSGKRKDSGTEPTRLCEFLAQCFKKQFLNVFLLDRF